MISEDFLHSKGNYKAQMHLIFSHLKGLPRSVQRDVEQRGVKW